MRVRRGHRAAPARLRPWPAPRPTRSPRDRRRAGSCRAAATNSPLINCSACRSVSQCPCLVMPMGTTSYLLRSMACMTDAADKSETSCSPLRPPKSTPTRSFFTVIGVGLPCAAPYDYKVLRELRCAEAAESREYCAKNCAPMQQFGIGYRPPGTRSNTASQRRYSIFFPNAELASSTASSAVRLYSSITGLTSTMSIDVMRPWSAMISIARCASR